MKLDPFIEAEEADGHSVKHCCDMFEVSRAAYYQRRTALPSAREVSDAELSDKIKAIHADSDGTYGSPRVHQELRRRGIHAGKRRVARLMRLAGHGHRFGQPSGRGLGVGRPHAHRARLRGIGDGLRRATAGGRDDLPLG